jgi:hypothetical protein
MNKALKILFLGLFVGSLVLMPLYGCSQGTAAPATAPQTASPAPAVTSAGSVTTTPQAVWKWPAVLHVAARGTSGVAKEVSWIAPMEASTGMTIRVRQEALVLNIIPLLKNNEVTLATIERTGVASAIEAIQEDANAKGGPFMPGVVWNSSLGSQGYMVRGNSTIFKPRDLKAPVKAAVNSMKDGSTGPILALLAWAGLSEKDVVWVNVGSTDAVSRAVVEGKADVGFVPPIAPDVFDAASAPSGIRFIDMNPNEDPDGLKRFLDIRPMYMFAPSQDGPEHTRGTWMPTGYTPILSNYYSDSELIYQIVKWLNGNFDKYKDKYASNRFMTLDHTLTMLETTFIPVHPGLQKFLKEKGVWTPAHEERNKFNMAWIQEYIDAWTEALARAKSQNITVDPLNEKWIELWENLKKDKKIPLLGMHPSLTVNAKVRLPAGYVPPTPEPEVKPSEDVPIEIVEIKGLHPGQHAVVKLKTIPGAKVTLVFTMPTGADSQYPVPNQKVADKDGMVTFEWDPHYSIPSGRAKLTITAKTDTKESKLVHQFQF